MEIKAQEHLRDAQNTQSHDRYTSLPLTSSEQMKVFKLEEIDFENIAVALVRESDLLHTVEAGNDEKLERGLDLGPTHRSYVH